MNGHSSSREPRWLRLLAFASASAVGAFGSVGLALAVIGVYRPALVAPLGAAVWIALLAVARPMLRTPGSSDPADHLIGASVVAFVASVASWNATHASQHVLINRDGGVYANAGRWIAGHGNLRVVAASGPFAHQAGLTFGSVGIYDSANHVLSFQFAHLLPALLAEARQLGGDRLMFAAPALLSGVALLALFVAARRFFRNPVVAASAVVAFAFVLPEVSFSRDTVSEIPSQVLVFTALWILADRRALRRPRTAFLAGAFLGLLQATRIDALALIIGLPLLFATSWILADAADRRGVAAGAAACVAGLVPGVVLGFADLATRSDPYLHSLRDNVSDLAAAAMVSLLLSLAIVVVVPRLAPRRVHLPRGFAWIAAAAVAAAGFGAWLIRPHVEHVHKAANSVVSAHQAAANIAIDPTRTYWERSLTWMSWYLGPVTVAAAIAAAALLVRSLLRRRSLDALGGLALLGPASILYLWHASALPDQLWVDRRFLDSALPLLTLLCFGLVAALARWAPVRLPRALPVAAAVITGVVATLYPIAAVAAVPNMTEQRGDLAVIDDACRILGPHAAVVVLADPTEAVYQTVPQTLRGWCHADVAIMTSPPRDQGEWSRLATAWSRRNTTLWIVAGDTTTIRAALPGSQVRTTPTATNPYLLRSTLVRRPSDYTTERFTLALAAVPSG